MPDFNNAKNAADLEVSKVEGALKRISEADNRPPLPFEPRCEVCTSPYRHFIDSMLVKGGYSYVYIANTVPGKGDKKIDRRSVANHAKKHLGFQEQALRALLEEEADMAEQNYEEGVRGAITHRGVLEIAVRKAYDDIIWVGSVSPIRPIRVYTVAVVLLNKAL